MTCKICGKSVKKRRKFFPDSSPGSFPSEHKDTNTDDFCHGFFVEHNGKE